ncbi:inner membrane mitoribosome receptor Mba1p, mitochondrial [Diutina catenulata]
MLVRSGLRSGAVALFAARPSLTPSLAAFRGYATLPEAQKKKKKEQGGDISMVPISSIGVMADFYVPPPLKKCPATSWHKLVGRRLIQFAVNTYSIAKYKRETKLKLEFNQWKETGMEQFVRVNKVFAAACNKRPQERDQYLTQQLDGAAGTEVINALKARAATFPAGTKISWDLVSVESNPKVISFNALPDHNNLTAFVQFIMQVTTKQKVTISNASGNTETETVAKDNLVYTLDPFAEEQRLVGTLFESDHLRKVQPDGTLINPKTMLAFTKKCADIYRANPRDTAVEKK